VVGTHLKETVAIECIGASIREHVHITFAVNASQCQTGQSPRFCSARYQAQGRLAQFEGRAPIPEAIALQGGRAGFGVFHGHSDVEKGVGV